MKKEMVNMEIDVIDIFEELMEGVAENIIEIFLKSFEGDNKNEKTKF